MVNTNEWLALNSVSPSIEKAQNWDGKPKIFRMPFSCIKNDTNSFFCYKKLSEVVEMNSGFHVSNFNVEDGNGKSVCVYWEGNDKERGVDDLTQFWSTEDCVEIVVTGLHNQEATMKPVKPSAMKGISAVIKEENKRDDIRHLVDDFKDHITDKYAPPFHRGKESVDMHWTYTIDGRPTKSPYFAIDAIYLDLQYVCNDPRAVRLLVPRKVFDTFRCAANVPMANDGLKSTDYLQAINAKLDMDNPPHFVSVEPYEQEGSLLCTRNEGSLPEIMERGHHNRIYKITGFFKLDNCDGDVEQVFHLNLVGLRAFSSHDDIQSIEKVNNAMAFA